MIVYLWVVHKFNLLGSENKWIIPLNCAKIRAKEACRGTGRIPGDNPRIPGKFGKQAVNWQERDGDGRRKRMRLKNILIVVKNIEKSRQFYQDLFGLSPVVDHGGNMILTEGLVLQEEGIWKSFIGKEIIPQGNSCELYFEERDIEGFVKKLEEMYPTVTYVNKLMEHSWGQKVVRFYDPDGNLIEVGTPFIIS
ncbi:hypothetical protein IMSAGC019_02362 [Lachnospiraceae bacterium]|nr:hypothetical protein IMSAGC019_02362 [Lachnospiraceae bacterium]